MRYKILLFDLDDTLLDFGANETDSLTRLFRQFGYAYPDELFRHYHTVNKQLWAEYESGAITLDVVLNSRFSETMLKLGKVVNGPEWEALYRELLGEGDQVVMDDALDVCRRLSATHRLFVVTNGITRTQIKRLKQSGLDEFFEDIFDSQSIGAQKPSPAFFDHVMRHIPDFNRHEALIIGDSLNTDIKGGQQAGIDTCWINRNRAAQSGPQAIPSTYAISSLTELLAICAEPGAAP
ncbi:YjjG family noncanonical pyrimidine nucleotidase [Paenibacillus sp. MWE-103]|uniref:YjjG family noncanonical pyrimidine nucleotidase n=1 Tax=Paenibacillus artemisiicola TaxID=1172618 RepID=A0ABS3WFM2_9BACL|nr:YjjG family noncanonical pyrimidine nucleotidase [Paenibacillus artemisiicola]MBO7747122.1 YjjG family noncanonical pyrimidine nucleotidase [Paenibacillus artemisiicola]